MAASHARATANRYHAVKLAVTSWLVGMTAGVGN
jgi:hypothetical protein